VETVTADSALTFADMPPLTRAGCRSWAHPITAPLSGEWCADQQYVLWFYFGYSSYFTLAGANGWPLAEAEKWLLTQASSALLA
jgi:hypothetical protein